MPLLRSVLSLICLSLIAGACSRAPGPLYDSGEAGLVEVAQSERQWTGLAISSEGRIFVNYPRWSDAVPVSVAELGPEGEPRPYPDASWNAYSPEADPAKVFVCVQSVVRDSQDDLWILDPANPKFGGVVEGGPKLLHVDLETDRVLRVYRFDAAVAPENSYLNDVRVDRERGYAYLTDSGAGALVVLNLESGASRRLLAQDPSTMSEDVLLRIGGKPWRRADGSRPQVHADGIALGYDGKILFFQSLTGRNMYSILTRYLRDESLLPFEIAREVNWLGETGAADGLLFGPDQRIYISALEENAVRALDREGRVTTVVQDPRIAWPDSFALGPDGLVYFTTSQIHLGANPPEPYRIFKIAPEKP